MIDFMRDPHGVSARWRNSAPVQALNTPLGVRVWVISRYEDALAALHDERLRKSADRLNSLLGLDSPLVSPHMLFSDPPDHTRLRSLVSGVFTARRVAALRQRVHEVTAALLDGLSGVVDIVDALAYPLPITMICELLGIPDADRVDFRTWTNALSSSADSADAAKAMTEYLRSLLAAPGDGLLADLTGELTGDELIGTAFLLITGGYETTANLIANGVLALLTHPDALAELRADPSLLPRAVTEFLRYDCPVNLASMRYTAEPVSYAGVEIPADEIVLIGLSSANRDATRFPAPGTLDLRRPGTGHLAFGHGAHHCLGAALARIEGEEAIGQLISRFPGLRLAVDPSELTYRFSLLMRSLETLPVSVDPAPEHDQLR
ncbi:cytochrome P450 [Lentzea sp. NBRC 105346]|uniref:cytochrome P450 family protein n=1 Tax=Lentzea sp. NBRC 105346 TaxID=3032205 RepID=UPI002554EA03|nr:cytochrome P450 [Lentzea sp. NBRC 105346]